jgi:hypothetical protein
MLLSISILALSQCIVSAPISHLQKAALAFGALGALESGQAFTTLLHASREATLANQATPLTLSATGNGVPWYMNVPEGRIEAYNYLHSLGIIEGKDETKKTRKVLLDLAKSIDDESHLKLLFEYLLTEIKGKMKENRFEEEELENEIKLLIEVRDSE